MNKKKILSIECPCGKSVTVKPCRKNRTKYCGKKCFYKFRKRPSGLKYNIYTENKGWFGKKEIVKPTERGYIKRQIKGVMKYEHRRVVEESLGRRLSQDEVVHHLDGDRTNNKIDNLVVMDKKDHDGMHHYE